MIESQFGVADCSRMIESHAHHSYYVNRAKRARSNGRHEEYEQWMRISSLRKGDPIEFFGFTASFIGVLHGIRLCLVYEVGGTVHRLGVDDLAD